MTPRQSAYPEGLNDIRPIASSARPGAAEAERLAGSRLLRSFEGTVPPADLRAAVGAGRAAGVTLFRAANIADPGQLRALCAALQAARPAGDPPLLIAVDQEGGQLQAIGPSELAGNGPPVPGAIESGPTAWPGNLAIAATGSVDLARRTGAAMGAELAALGVNVDYAPCCDLLDDPRNPVMGTRTFGDEAGLAARLAAAFVRGLQSAGVAATLKHVPGHGAAAGDSHHGLPVLDADLEVLRRRELVPFRAGAAAGARLAMLGHLAVPALTGGVAMPASLSPELAGDLLRGELGFRGVSITDALNMGALAAFGDLPELAVLAAAAGVDLLLAAHDPATEDAALTALAGAIRSGQLDPAACRAAARRVRALRRWLGGPPEQPALSVVGAPAHHDLARETAERSITLLRDRGRLLPLPRDGRRIVVIAPAAVDLTPADTSSYLRLRLADTLRAAGYPVDDLTCSIDPTEAEIAALRGRLTAAGSDPGAGAHAAPVAVVGTIDAPVNGGQARLVEALVAARVPTVAVALRTPVDLVAYPDVGTAIAAYGLQPPTLWALAATLAGTLPFRGRLPVRLPPLPA